MTALQIRVLTGPHRDQNYCFRTPIVCTIGRGEKCMVRFTGDQSDLMISRLHCVLVMDPPHFQLRDLDSRNGTYLNGRKIGQDENTVIVQDGDILTLGGTTLRIGLVDGPDAADADFVDISAEESGKEQDCLVAC